MDIIRRTFAFKGVEFKADGDGPGSFSGYGSTFGNVDDGGDVIIKGAFSDAIDDFKQRGFIAVGHDWFGLPVATVLDAKEDDAGLWVEAEFHSTQNAQDARTTIAERIARGKFVGLSIGYLVDWENEGAEVREDGVRVINKIKELAEISLVTVPMNRQAGVAAVKAGPGAASFTERTEGMLSGLQAFAAGINFQDFVDHAVGHVHMRRDFKEGRVLSAANRARLSSIQDLCEEISSGSSVAAKQLAAVLTDPDNEKRLTLEQFQRRERLRDVDLLLAEYEGAPRCLEHRLM